MLLSQSHAILFCNHHFNFLSLCLDTSLRFPFFFFLFLASAAVIDQVSSEQLLYIVHGFYQLHFSVIFLLKIGSTVLITHLKIILLQYF